MLYLFYGADTFSKRERVKALAAKEALKPVWHHDEDALPEARVLGSSDLFSGKQLHVLEDLLSSFEEGDLVFFVASDNHIIFFESSLDKRTNKTKHILALGGIKAEEFSVPEVAQLPGWIEKRAKELGMTLERGASAVLSERIAGSALAGFAAPSYSFEHVNAELVKLQTYAAGEQVTKEMVELLVSSQVEVAIFDITNAVTQKQSARVFSLLNQFFESGGSSDEKTKTIQLNGLLADQLRSMLVVKDFDARRVPDSEILKATGWKSGRLHIVRKHAASFPDTKLLDVLKKLESLDEELKSSSLPARVLFDLITVQLLA